MLQLGKPGYRAVSRLIMATVVGMVLFGAFSVFGYAATTTTIDVYIRPNANDEFVYDALKAGFEKAYPNIKVNYLKSPIGDYWQKIEVMYAAGTPPDVIFPSTSKTVEYASLGMLLPLDNQIKAEKFDLDQYFKPIVDQYRVNGLLYGLPNDFAANAVSYNIDLFAARGVSAPGLDWTVDEFVDKARKLTYDSNGDGKIDIFGTGMPATPFWIWSALGTNFFDNEQTPHKFLLNQPDAFNALQSLHDLRWQYHVTPQPGESCNFDNGTCAMLQVGHWVLPNTIKVANFNWGLLTSPRFKYSVQRNDGSSWAIIKTAAHPQEAWTFIKYAGGFEGQMLLAKEQFITPAHRRVASSNEWQRIPGKPQVSKTPFTYGLDHAFNNYILSHPRGVPLVNLVNGALNKVLNNQDTPQGAINSILTTVQQMLDELYK